MQTTAPHATARASVTHGHEVQPTPQEPTGARWFCLHLRSRFEFAVRDALNAADITTFLPTREEAVRWSDRQTVTTRPLFPGYLFARFTVATVPAIRATRGVVTILSTEQQPTPIPDEVMTNLQRFAAQPAAVECCPYVAGSTVRVERGPFAGVSGVVTRTKGATTLTIPVEILGRAVSVEIDAADVAQA